MKIVQRIIGPFWKIWFAIWFVVPFIFLFPFFFFSIKTERFDMTFKLKRVWARIICFFTLLYPRVRFASKPYKMPKPCVVVPNHTSYLDIVFSPFYLDHTAVFMAKSELKKIPLFKYFFMGFDIPVTRKSLTDAHKAFVVAGERIEQGISMVIFPEGTIGDKGILRPFKNGAFKLAIEKQVLLIPVVNLNNWYFLENGGFLKTNGRPGIPEIIVGDPIETKGKTEADLEEIKKKVHTFIQQELDKFNAKKN
jgi:1-acyl-sn-glycerol-3-phosphate acyltransferase